MGWGMGAVVQRVGVQGQAGLELGGKILDRRRELEKLRKV